MITEYACNSGDTGLVPGSGRSPGEGNDNPLLCILAWKIPWTRGACGLQSMELQSDGHDLATKEQQRNLIMNFKDYFFKGT